MDTVFHLASMIDLARKMSKKMEAINVQGTKNIASSR